MSSPLTRRRQRGAGVLVVLAIVAPPLGRGFEAGLLPVESPPRPSPAAPWRRRVTFLKRLLTKDPEKLVAKAARALEGGDGFAALARLQRLPDDVPAELAGTVDDGEEPTPAE